jgi:hypothetical protein
MPYPTQTRRHPRAGIAIGAVVLVAWLAAIALAATSDGSTGSGDSATPGSSAVQAPPARTGRAAPGYFQAGSER